MKRILFEDYCFILSTHRSLVLCSINFTLPNDLFFKYSTDLNNIGYIFVENSEETLTDPYQVKKNVMINHVVLFKLKEFGSAEEKQSALNEFKEKLINLKKHIPQLKFIEVGKYYKLESPSFDLCLISHFDSLADLDIYREHPEHLKVLKFAGGIVADRAAVDYEF